MTAGKYPVFGPGGGGGAGSPGFNGAGGYAGQVELVYTPGGNPTFNSTRFLLAIPSGGDVDGGIPVRTITTGTVIQLDCIYNTASGGELTLKGYNSGATLLFTSTSITGLNGGHYMVSVESQANGTTVNYALRVLNVSTGVVTSQTGTVAGTNSMGTVTNYNVNPLNNLGAVTVGHVVVQYASESLTSVWQAIQGWAGELAAARFERLCNEEGIPFVLTSVAGTADTPAMGPQPDATLVSVLQQVEDLDRGLLFEPMSVLGLGYRTYASLASQVQPVLVADYAQGMLSPPFQPTYDDQLTRNDLTITRVNGSSFSLSQATGTMSTQDPPNGVGDYTYSLTVNANSDSELAAVATPILALGTVDEFRYPVITFDLTRTEVQQVFGYLTKLVEGDYLQVVNPPSFLTQNPVNQLITGFTVDLSAFQFTIALNCIPQSPFA